MPELDGWMALLLSKTVEVLAAVSSTGPLGIGGIIGIWDSLVKPQKRSFEFMLNELIFGRAGMGSLDCSLVGMQMLLLLLPKPARSLN